MEKKELRYNPVEFRVLPNDNGEETRVICGTAIVFNTQSALIDKQGIKFYEVITPEAITPELIAASDIVMLYNHEEDAGVLARSKKGVGSLQILITDTGVDFQFEAPKSPIGDNVLESVKRGDLDSCSFAFRAKQGGDVWQKVGDYYQRTVNAIELLADFSIVVNPAYTDTCVDTRGLEQLIEVEKIDVEAAEQRNIALELYYENLKNIINSL